MSIETTEWEWEACSVAALDAYTKARRAEAVHLWRRAKELSARFPANDPRHATSLNNATISAVLSEDHDQAYSGFEAALELWQNGLGWTDSMTVTPVARSSLFHFRMEQRHSDAFAEVRRNRNKILLDGSLALTRFNLALCCFFRDVDDIGDRLLGEALAEREQSCGTNNPEYVQIARVISGRLDMAGRLEAANEIDQELQSSADELTRSALEIWRQEQPGELTDMRRLLSAAYLTAMVHERDFL